MFTCAVSLWDILFNIAGKVGIFSDKRAQGCSHSIRSFKAGEEAGEIPEILFLCCDHGFWILSMSPWHWPKWFVLVLSLNKVIFLWVLLCLKMLLLRKVIFY